MKIKLKGSILATAILTLLSSASIPAAMSKPSDLFTPVDRVYKPIDRAIIIDRNPNGMQVRVLFKLRDDEKLVCNDANIVIKIQDDSKPLPTDGGLIAYPLVRQYKSKLSASTSNATCIYNFTVQQTDIGKRADISINGLSSTGNGSFVGSQYFTIKNTKQTMIINGSIQPPPA
jgi:hypothetical protein